MGNYYSYMRISTAKERQKQKFNRQEVSINRYCKENDITLLFTFKDDCSGKDLNRPEWQKLMKIAREGDTIIFKDISRFSRLEPEEAYAEYMKLLDANIEMIFIDNYTISTPYIKELLNVAKQQDLIARVSMESTIKLLLLVELQRTAREREITIKRIKDGIAASEKKSGKAKGSLDKMTPELHSDIENYLKDRTIKQVDLLKKHKISRTTMNKYIKVVQAEKENDSQN